MRDSWIIYAVFGVLVCLLLWRVATQWKVRSTEAENLRASLIILGVIALTLVVWQGAAQLAGPIIDAHSQDETITVFAAASMKDALDEVDADFTKQTGIKVVSMMQARH
jgi:spermidine/putrescine-binding protein